MKSIAYSILSASSFWLGCYAPAFVDRAFMTGVGLACLMGLIFQPPKEPTNDNR